jgi:hypothetical protein
MSITTGTFPGVRIADMPDLGAVNDASSFVGERAGSGRFSALALARYVSNSVKSAGAVGDGVYDDTSAIQGAVNALAGACGAVFFPAGTYRITAPINIPPCVSRYGVGPASKIAPATAGQIALSFVNSTVLDNDAAIHDLQITPTADGCIGIRATNCRNLSIHDCTFTGCAGNSIALDRCEYYAIEDCHVRDSLSYLGGTVLCQSSVWNSVSGGYLGGNGTITRVRFSPLTGGGFDNASPCIHLISQPTTSISHCYLAWGAFGNGPVDFIVLENQCQGNVLTANVALGVNNGITIQPGSMANCVMPAYITLTDNAIDSFGGIAIGVLGTAALPGAFINISGGTYSETQQQCTAAAIASGGSGYTVGDLLLDPAPPAAQEGAQVILRVTSVGGGGAVSGVTIFNAGLTQTPPGNPVPFTGGTGSGATFNLTYQVAQACIWLAHASNCTVRANGCLNYGGVSDVGYGVVMDTVTKTVITDNQIIGMHEGIFFGAGACSGIILGTNYLFNTNNIGGPIPTASVFQDNLNLPFLTTTPAMPASGAVVTNTAPYPQQVVITGGSVTQVLYLALPIPVTVGTTTILTLQPTHTIALTYTVAPGWAWIPML